MRWGRCQRSPSATRVTCIRHWFLCPWPAFQSGQSQCLSTSMNGLGSLLAFWIVETMSTSWVTWKINSSSSFARSIGSLFRVMSRQGGENAMQWTGRLLCWHSWEARWYDAKWWKVQGSIGCIEVIEMAGGETDEVLTLLSDTANN